MGPCQTTTRRHSAQGVTLIELVISLVLMSVLGWAAVTVFNVVILSWSNQVERTGIDIQLDRAVEVMARDLREAIAVQSTADYDEVRYSEDSSTHYIFYLYHASDAYTPPPAFDQDTYELRKTALTGGIGGTFTYGDGDLLLTDVIPPATTDLSISGNLVIVDLSVQREDETVCARTQVRPRNL